MNKLLQRLDRFWNDQSLYRFNRAYPSVSRVGRNPCVSDLCCISRHEVAAPRPAGGAETRIGHIAVTATLGCGRCAIASM